MIATGGKTVYGATIGILMLQTRFPRIPGDMGNALTWPFPVMWKVVPGATPDRVVRQKAEGLLDGFIESAREMVAAGADGITTTCGFLSLFQPQLAEALGVPVATSSLMQAPMIQSLLAPGRQVGILTISKPSLTPEHLSRVGVAADTPVWGTEGGTEFTRRILADDIEMDIDAARADLVNAARDFQAAHPELGAILMECTNMMPYAADVRRVTGLPVFSIRSFVCWFQSALAPARFPDP